MSRYLIDLSERVGAAKGGLASFLGRKDTAALLPAGADPASRL